MFVYTHTAKLSMESLLIFSKTTFTPHVHHSSSSCKGTSGLLHIMESNIVISAVLYNYASARKIKTLITT